MQALRYALDLLLRGEVVIFVLCQGVLNFFDNTIRQLVDVRIFAVKLNLILIAEWERPCDLALGEFIGKFGLHF